MNFAINFRRTDHYFFLVILFLFFTVSDGFSIGEKNRQNNQQNDEINFYEDVPLDHWAYGAVMELTKRGVLEGYGGIDSRIYKGETPLTRYQFAQALSKAIKRLEADSGISRPDYEKEIDVRKIFKESGLSEDNIKLLSMLMEEFKKELADLNIRLTELETEKRSGLNKKIRLPLIFGITGTVLGVLSLILAIIALILL